MWVKEFSFNSGTAAAGNTIQVTGLPGTPKLVLLDWSGITGSVDAVAGGDIHRGWGAFKSASERFAFISRSVDNNANSAASHGHTTDACVAATDGSSSFVALLDPQSMDANGFTLVIDDGFGGTPGDIRINGYAIGGDEVQVEFFSLNSRTSAGTQDLTSLSFSPDTVIAGLTWGTTDPPYSNQNDSFMSIGVWAKDGTQGHWAGGSNTAAGTMQTVSSCNDDEFLVTPNSTGASCDYRARITAALSNGFTLTVDENSGSVAHRIRGVAIKGLQSTVTSYLTGTGTSDVVNSSVPFTGLGMMTLSAGAAETTSNTLNDHDRWSMGFATTGAGVCMATLDEDATASSSSETARAVEHDEVDFHFSLADAMDGKSSRKSWNTNSGYTIQIDDAYPVSSFVLTWILGQLTQGTAAQTLPIATQASSGNAAHAGTAVQTLPVSTQSASGSVRHHGTAEQAIPIATQAATGSTMISGTAAQTIPMLGQSASGHASRQGISAQLIPMLTQIAAGMAIHLATAAQALPAAQQAAEGAVTHIFGQASQSSPAPSQASSGTVARAGSAAQVLPAATMAAAGDVLFVDGSAAATLPPPNQAAAGATTHQGSAAQALPAPTQSATGQRGQAGAAEQAIPAPQQAAEGDVLQVYGAAAQTLPVPSQEATGTSTRQGSAAQVLPILAQAGSGTATHQGTAAQQLPAPTQAAAGQVPVRGEAAQALPLPALAAAGHAARVGEAAQVLPAPTQASAGASTHLATAAQVLPVPTMAAAGQRVELGTAAQQLPAPTQAASGSSSHLASASMQLPILGQAASGIVARAAAGAMALPAPVQAAAGSLAHAGSASMQLPIPTQTASALAFQVGGQAAQALPMFAIAAAGEIFFPPPSTVSIVTDPRWSLELAEGEDPWSLAIPDPARWRAEIV